MGTTEEGVEVREDRWIRLDHRLRTGRGLALGPQLAMWTLKRDMACLRPFSSSIISVTV